MIIITTGIFLKKNNWLGERQSGSKRRTEWEEIETAAECKKEEEKIGEEGPGGWKEEKEETIKAVGRKCLLTSPFLRMIGKAKTDSRDMLRHIEPLNNILNHSITIPTCSYLCLLNNK